MFGKNRNKKVGLCVMVVTAGLVMATLWAVLATPETALAKRPPGGVNSPPVLFDVTTEDGNDMVIVGYFDAADSSADEYGIVRGPAQGRAGETGGSHVYVNRPPVAIRMDFLAELDDSFTIGAIYGLDHRGTLDIRQNKDGTADAIYFFKAHGKNWEDGDKLTGYRIDADAKIVSDSSFPREEPVGGGYTVILSNIRLSVDTGSRKNGYEGSFPNASATVKLVRTQ